MKDVCVSSEVLRAGSGLKPTDFWAPDWPASRLPACSPLGSFPTSLYFNFNYFLTKPLPFPSLHAHMYLMSFYSKRYKLAVDFCMNFSQKDPEENIILWILHFPPYQFSSFMKNCGGNVWNFFFLNSYLYIFLALKVIFMVWFCFFLYSKQGSALSRTAAVMLGFLEQTSRDWAAGLRGTLVLSSSPEAAQPRAPALQH